MISFHEECNGGPLQEASELSKCLKPKHSSHSCHAEQEVLLQEWLAKEMPGDGGS